MGQPKQLLKFRGTSLLRRAIDTALAVPADQVIVVLGHAVDQLLPECEATSATDVLNDQWMEGVSTSLRGGLAAVSSDARGVFIYPAQMPLVQPEARRHEDRDRPSCRSCGFIHYLDPKVAVAVILGDEHGVLLCRRCIDPGSGRWSFPAGYVNRGEVLEDAALREVLEELGVVVR